VESGKHVAITDVSEKRDRIAHWFTLHKFGECSCKLFERMGIPCRHILLTLRSENIYELHSAYILKR
jgi:zinc finger SWIM domain-containing protein 3